MQINRSRLFKNFFEKKDSREIKYIVLHHVAAKNFDEAIAAFKANRVSSHYIINSDGEIFLLVEEKYIAWHAGYSYWRGEDGLNKSSVGIEFYNPDPTKKKFTKKQINAGTSLIHELIKKYKIAPINIVGHSDIAYFPNNFHLDRKQDPSHLFPWHMLATKGIGLWPKVSPYLGGGSAFANPSSQVAEQGGAYINFQNFEDKILFSKKDHGIKIKNLKTNLNNFGYKIKNIDEQFDEQLSSVIKVFNLRFNNKLFAEDGNNWYLSSDKILAELLR